MLLHDETKQSQWCQVNPTRRACHAVAVSFAVSRSQAEWQCAKENRIPLIVIVDIDKFPARQLIKTYIEDGYDFLFAVTSILQSSSPLLTDRPATESGHQL